MKGIIIREVVIVKITPVGFFVVFCTTKYKFEPLTFYDSNDNIHTQIFELRREGYVQTV